jgi:hypothetical protein
MAAINFGELSSDAARQWEERDMDPHMRAEPLIVVSLIGGFAPIIAVCRIGDEHEPSCRVAPGDTCS